MEIAWWWRGQKDGVRIGMPVSVYIPTPFRRITSNRENVTVEGSTVGEVLDAMEREFPGFANLVYDGDHRVPTHINVYLNNTEIHDLDGIETPVSDGDQVAVIPALAGGAGDDVAPAVRDKSVYGVARPRHTGHTGVR